ncbi:MAG: ROK family protein [Nanoarchaeota archaeon]|nr:ROK family protein [Nanoarchaeota archaeon]
MILALDIGATHIRSALVAGKIVKERKVIDTPSSKKQIIKSLFKLIDSYPSVTCICAGVASFISKGVTKNTQNMDFANVNVKKLFEQKYKVPVYIDNDANCAGLAELIYGKGKGKKNFLVLTLGTGIGGAVIINGSLYRGNSFAGEPGQLLINGKRLEQLASGSAALKMAISEGLKMDNPELNRLAMSGNSKAKAIYKNIGYSLGLGILNISYIFDPEIFIIGGGFSNVTSVIKEATTIFHRLDVIQRKIPVVRTAFGDDAGLIGSALLTIDNSTLCTNQ